MSSYQLTPQAVEDLFEIWSYIAGDDLDAANRVERGNPRCLCLPGGYSARRKYSRGLDGAAVALLTLPELLDCIQSRRKSLYR